MLFRRFKDISLAPVARYVAKCRFGRLRRLGCLSCFVRVKRDCGKLRKVVRFCRDPLSLNRSAEVFPLLLLFVEVGAAERFSNFKNVSKSRNSIGKKTV